ncbi:hypothetical protein CC80DRAFT_548621 [Byssothecium circinans]|uniref:Uncharacterized protein n=1 Tax=Byssothecium circinans TaxID=147558 RepID=A0A6A5TTP6_9PLEO|nr:hypothetical protein CC80DRAFT_548621 [Byssothecium circinans]
MRFLTFIASFLAFTLAILSAPAKQSYTQRDHALHDSVHYLPPNVTHTNTLARRYANITRRYPNITICGEASHFALDPAHPGKTHTVPLLGFGVCTRLDDGSQFVGQSAPINKVELTNKACACSVYSYEYISLPKGGRWATSAGKHYGSNHFEELQ